MSSHGVQYGTPRWGLLPSFGRKWPARWCNHAAAARVTGARPEARTRDLRVLGISGRATSTPRNTRARAAGSGSVRPGPRCLSPAGRQAFAPQESSIVRPVGRTTPRVPPERSARVDPDCVRPLEPLPVRRKRIREARRGQVIRHGEPRPPVFGKLCHAKDRHAVGDLVSSRSRLSGRPQIRASPPVDGTTGGSPPPDASIPNAHKKRNRRVTRSSYARLWGPAYTNPRARARSTCWASRRWPTQSPSCRCTCTR